MNRAIPAFAVLFFFLIVNSTTAQIVINEYVPANINGFINAGQADDWIELYNSSSSAINLQGYGLSVDSANAYKFRFPSYTLQSHDYVLVFPKNETDIYPANHWETAVNANTTWKYFPGTSQPDTNWRNISFNSSGWASGPGGMGFGDNDDATIISTNCRSVMMLKSFNVPDTSNILKAIFNMDYDDGFVAFLNGVEIARANLGVVGDRPHYNDLAILSHEAQMYQGLNPDSFYIDPVFLKSVLRQGVNVLAVETHNQTPTSNDLTSKPYLSFGMRNSGLIFSNPPSWFGTHPPENFTANFKLSRHGATISLTNPSGDIVDQETYTEMQQDNSRGRKPDGTNNWCLFGTPTPKSSNYSSTCFSGYANQPVFSIGAGFYPSSQLIVLTNSTPGGVIRYTTNGDVPTTSSTSYSSPIQVTSDIVIRARVFASGYLPSLVVTNSYIISNEIHLPVFSITTDSLNLWDWNTGIYVLGPNADSIYPYHGANYWQHWQKPATIEYFDKNKNLISNFDAEIKIHGNYSREKPQKSFEISLKSEFGTSSLNYVLIPDKPFIDKTSDIILRNSGTDWNVVHFRDAFMQRVLKPTHTGYTATEPIVMYLNGSYWGVYTINENPDNHWIENNFHYKKNNIDFMYELGHAIQVKNGTNNFFWDSYNYATTQNPSSSQYYNDMNNFWDLDNYKDYFIMETYYNNHDWIGDWTNNIIIWRSIVPSGKLKYLVCDLDMGCGYTGTYNDSALYKAISPVAPCYSSDIFSAMLNNPRFKREFINRYADLINTTFLSSKMLAVMHQFQDSMSFDMTKHFAKWGSTMSNWQTNINIMTNYINHRPAVERNQIQDVFSMTSQVTLTFNVSPAGSGRIQVSTIVPDTYPWTGVYFNGNPVTITAIPNPGYTFNHWNSNHAITNDPDQTTTYNFSKSTETITAYFTGSAQPAKLTISEFNYHSDSILNSNDWIEIHNYGSIAIDLSGWKFKDQNDYDSYIFPVGTVLSPNGYLVVATDLSSFSKAFPTVNNFIGPLGFNLSKNGDQIRLFNPEDVLYLSFFYQNTPPWPVEADGQGFTCELSADNANLNDGNSWFPGCNGGSPGRAYTASLSTTTHVSGNSTFCIGSQTLLSVNYTPGYSYQWQRNHINIPSATDSIYTATQGGDYSILASNRGCSSISDTLHVISVTLGQSPVVTSASRCGEGSVTLSANASDSIYWFDAPHGNMVGTGSTFNTPTLTNSTTYYTQASLTCPSAVIPVIAFIIPVTATPVVSNVSRCGPGIAIINAVDTSAINWYNDPVGGALIFTGDIFITGYIPNDTTFYVEAGNGCNSDRVAVDVAIISSLPPVVNSSSRCGSGSLDLSASSLSPVFWYDSLIAGNQVGSGANFQTPVLTESKNYYAESNNGCPSARIQAIAMVNTIPIPPAATDSFRCGNGSVALYATSNFQIFWYNTPTGGTSLGSGSLFNTPLIDSSTTFYAESDDICISNRTPVIAIIEPLPDSPIGIDANICGSGAVFLSAAASDSIYWFAQTSGSAVLGTGNLFITPVLDTTTVFYAVSISNCTSLPTAVIAKVTPLPSVLLGNDTMIASGTILFLDAGPGFDSYHWSTGETTQTITVNSTNNYSVEVSLNGCSSTDTITINVVLGIQSNSTMNGSINLYPNPVKDRLIMQFESEKSIPAVISVCDITGKKLINESIRLNNGINIHTFDMSGYAKGIYLFILKSNDFTKTMSITIE